MEPFIARWDLDKTYLRTDFDTVRDLVRTAVERPDQKRTVPGAAALLRELGRAGVEIHILSGSPEQFRSRLEEKLRLDGARWASLTLKPNLQNLLRLRFRALRGQLGYKLPALLQRRAEMSQRGEDGALIREALLGDDAEADAFVYCLYGEICRGAVDDRTIAKIMREGGAYEDTIALAIHFAGSVEKGDVVERVLIHLDRQSSPSDFRLYGRIVVPFYNYLQAAFVLFEDHRIGADQVTRVANDLVVAHNFDGGALARSYLDLCRRGHASGAGVVELSLAARDLVRRRGTGGASELSAMADGLEEIASQLPAPPSIRPPPTTVDYLALATSHNPRQARRR